ncbi:hypothetical protein ACOSQ4_010956 [Xanthoceras sorbifolium]
MDFLHAFPATIMAAIFASSLFVYCLLRILSRKTRGAWPFLGHLPLLGGQQPPHVTLGDMADKYGPIFSIKMGVYRTIVVSNWEMAKECLTTNDKVFANRPKMLIAEVMGYNYAMVGFSPYGPYWRQVRKIAVLELLSNHRVQMFKHVRETEVKAAVSLDMKKWLGDITLNVIYKITVGKRYVGTTRPSGDHGAEENDQWRDAVRRFFELAGKFVVWDALPFLRWLDFGGHEKAMKKTAAELDFHVQGWLEEHKRKRVSGKINSDHVEDFMDVMLSILEDGKLSTSEADKINKATCLPLIMAASDTTRVTLKWTLSQLLNNPDVLKKAQQELDTFIARGAWPFLGHLPLLGGQQPPHVTLGDMADKYGPIFSIKMGVYRTIVVSNWEMAKECLTTNDKVFANRPKMLIAEVMGYNYAMVGFSPYGPYWRQVRKIAVLELLSNHRVQMFKHVRETEVKAAVSLDMKKWLGDITLNVIYKITVGKRYVGTTRPSGDHGAEENDQWRDAVRRFFELAGKFVVWDALPFLRWLDFGGHEKAMKKTAAELDFHVQGWLEEHKRKRVSGKINSDHVEDFMDVMLSILEDGKLSTSEADKINKATCLPLIMAASDTTRVTLKWTLSQLLNNPDVLKKAQQELDTFIARGAWPFLGHLPLLGGQQPPHVTLGDMADKYGPIFSIKMGVYRTIVVSNWEMAKECLTTNDKVFANRPKMLIAEVMGYNYAMVGFSPYGPYWRQVRKIAVLELLSNHRVQMFKHVRETEVKAAVSLDMKKWLGDITLNVIYKITVGKRYVGTTRPSGDHGAEENDQWRDAVRRFFELAGKFVVWDALPFLRWLDFGGHEKAMKKTAAELDFHVQGWLEEHKRKRVSGKINSDHVEDFMDVMLSILEDGKLSTSEADKINKATCLPLIMAASDTTRVTLKWTLSQLLNNPDVLKKAQQELDTFIGRERAPDESDMKNLSLEDCTVGGCHVPAGTRLLVNIWKIHRDPRVWSDPYMFKPERFLTTHKDFDVKGQNFVFIPFSSGRRMCPGFSFALQIMQLTLATLLHGFEIETMLDAPVDLGEGFGTTNLRSSKLEALLTPRLPAYLYTTK